MSKKVLLDDYRNVLIRQEETIIFALIERAQFLRNSVIYRKRADATESLLSFKGKYHNFEGSFMDFMLSETERLHALNRRYTSPDEHAFFPSYLPDPILPPIEYSSVLLPNTININDQIMNVYLEKLLPRITLDDDDHTTYGSSANADIAVLQALSKRIHFGKFIAEAKFQAETDRYSELIRNNDAKGIMDALTNMVVEDKVAMRVRLKASTYGQDIDGSSVSTGIGKCKVDPQAISDLYRDYVMPLTKEVQVAYLLQRLHHPSVSYVGPVGSFAHSAALAHFGSSSSRNFEAASTLNDVFANVVANKTAYGIAAFEDTQTGIAKEAQLLLISSGLQVCAETIIERQFILAASEPSPTDILKVYLPTSAEAGFGMVIDRAWSTAKVIQVGSVDEAARCAQHQPNSIAVTTADAAQAYTLHVIETPSLSAINKPPPTLSVRFIVVGRNTSAATGKDKTILCLNVKHEVGSLLSALQVFKDNHVNMTCLESIQRGASVGEYGFYVELDGHIDNSNVQKALEALRSTTREVRFLGSFPVHR